MAGIGIGLVVPLRKVQMPVVARRLIGAHARAAELLD
jgi:hypothetical protein